MTIDELIAMAQEHLRMVRDYEGEEPEWMTMHATIAMAAAITAQAMMQRDEAAEARERAAPRWMFDFDLNEGQEAQSMFDGDLPDEWHDTESFGSR